MGVFIGIKFKGQANCKIMHYDSHFSNSAARATGANHTMSPGERHLGTSVECPVFHRILRQFFAVRTSYLYSESQRNPEYSASCKIHKQV